MSPYSIDTETRRFAFVLQDSKGRRYFESLFGYITDQNKILLRYASSKILFNFVFFKKLLYEII